jgi:predicted TIM-barrel fold metal-dependent hydrolase
MDSDLHTMEPDDLWVRYLDEPFRAAAPTFTRGAPDGDGHRGHLATDTDERVMRQVVEAIGDDNIVVSTDYPHSDGLFPDAMNEFVALEGVSDKAKGKILWDNYARLYPLAAGR